MQKIVKFSLLILALALAAVLTGCGTLGPNYQRPAIELPASAIKPQSAHTVASVDWLVWWTSFQDPALNALLDEDRKSVV